MKNVDHRTATVRRIGAIAVGLVLCASCSTTETSTVDTVTSTVDTVQTGDTAGPTTTPASGDTSPPPVEAPAVCTGAEYGDDTVILDGETLAAVAARVGRTEDELQRTNNFGIAGRPAFESADSLVVPCVENWPENTTFYELIDPATCEPEGFTLYGRYTVQPGQDAATIASQFGIAVDRLQAVDTVDLATIQPGDEIGVCQNWFE